MTKKEESGITKVYTLDACVDGGIIHCSGVNAENSRFRWNYVFSRLSVRCLCNFQRDTFTDWVYTSTRRRLGIKMQIWDNQYRANIEVWEKVSFPSRSCKEED